MHGNNSNNNNYEGCLNLLKDFYVLFRKNCNSFRTLESVKYIGLFSLHEKLSEDLKILNSGRF